eukprot:scaffold6074_cov70-Phaeocystis_antarctica.AAC.2
MAQYGSPQLVDSISFSSVRHRREDPALPAPNPKSTFSLLCVCVWVCRLHNVQFNTTKNHSLPCLLPWT